MLKKLSIALSVVAALGLALAIATPSPVDAKPQQKQQQKQQKFQKQKFVKQKNVQKQKWKVGQKVNGHIWFGHSRHRWHGVWYAYGVGPCWINIEGEWFWNELACPL